MINTCTVGYTCIKKSKKIITYKKKEKLSWKMALPPDESLNCKGGTVLICVQYIAGTCVHEHISPLLGEHLCILKTNLDPVTVHYREVSLYIYTDIYTSIYIYIICSVCVCLSSIGGQTAGPIMAKFGTHMRIDLRMVIRASLFHSIAIDCIVTNTEAPQGYVLSLLLFTL